MIKRRLSCFLFLAFVFACDAGNDDATPADAADDKAGEAAAEGEADAKPAENLPAAEELLAGHVEAAGGAAAIEKLEAIAFEAKLDTGRAGIRGTAKTWWQKDGRFLVEETLEGIGVSRVGFDGTQIWADDPVHGPRQLEGQEAEDYRVNASPFPCHDWKARFESAKTIGSRDLDGRKLWEVELKTPMGRQVTMGFDAETKLLATVQMKVSSPQGEVPTQTVFDDYREVGGYRFAHVQRSKLPGIFEIAHTYEKIDVEAQIDPAIFGRDHHGQEVVDADPGEAPAAEEGAGAPVAGAAAPGAPAN